MLVETVLRPSEFRIVSPCLHRIYMTADILPSLVQIHFGAIETIAKYARGRRCAVLLLLEHLGPGFRAYLF